MTKKSDAEPDAHEQAAEEARMRVIDESMERALGRGRLKMNPPKQDNDYEPHQW